MKFRTSFIVFPLSTFLVFASCKTTGDGGSDPIEPTPAGESGPNGTSGPGDAAGFLKTDYEPLQKWLDERFEVKYVAMTPESVFDQQPLKDIFYETVNLPVDAPALNFESPDISRRELLKKISGHWNLKMSLVNSEDGKPTAVRVEGR